jgi:hypothetical protein
MREMGWVYGMGRKVVTTLTKGRGGFGRSGICLDRLGQHSLRCFPAKGGAGLSYQQQLCSKAWQHRPNLGSRPMSLRPAHQMCSGRGVLAGHFLGWRDSALLLTVEGGGGLVGGTEGGSSVCDHCHPLAGNNVRSTGPQFQRGRRLRRGWPDASARGRDLRWANGEGASPVTCRSGFLARITVWSGRWMRQGTTAAPSRPRSFARLLDARCSLLGASCLRRRQGRS